MSSSSSSSQVPAQGTPYGIQSLDTVGGESSVHDDDDNPDHREVEGGLSEGGATERIRRNSSVATGQARNLRVSELQAAFAKAENRPPPPPPPHAGSSSPSNAALLYTPLVPGSPAPELSFLSTPRSYSSKSGQQDDSDSVADEAASQAIVSDEEDEGDMPAAIQDSAPQLIMPSIKMPSRRPFTERGKAMGRLKVLVAGVCGE